MGRHPFLAGVGDMRLDRFLSAFARAARHPGEEAIHDLRVAIRRLLAFIDLAEGLADGESPFPAEPASPLKHLMKPLGRLRDAQVKMLRLGALAPLADPVTWRYALAVASDADRREAAVVRALARTKPGKVRGAFRALPLSPLPAGDPCEKALALLAEREAGTDRLARRFLANRTPDALHELRLAFKAYRYTAEALSDFLPGLNAGTESRLHDFQTLLGDIHDFDVMLEEFRRFRGKVLGIQGGGNDIEKVLMRERAAKFGFLLSFLRGGKGIRKLFVRSGTCRVMKTERR